MIRVPMPRGLRRAAAAALACMGLLALSACVRAPRQAVTPSMFPFAVDTLRSVRLGDGAWRHFIYSATGPWAIHVMDLRLDRCLVPVAVKGGRSAVGRTTTTALLRGLELTREVVGGVNADFFLFTPPGVPTGAHVSNGRVITPPSRQPVFAIDSVGAPRITVLWAVRPDSFVVDDPRLATLSLLPFHPREAVGGRPILLEDSAYGPTVDTEGQPGFANGRHPRTAVGIAEGGKRLFLVVVDGRQRPYSDGMTLREVANLFRALGAPEAINLDGGGSSAMVVRRGAADTLRVVNRPSDPTGERAVGNALAVVRSCGETRARR